MTTWAARTTHLAAATTAVLGEPVLFSDGRTCSGIFDPLGVPVDAFGADLGMVRRVTGPGNPLLQLGAADAEGLEVGDVLMVREVAYEVVHILADGAGMARVELTAA